MNWENTVEALRIYRRNHQLTQCPYYVRIVSDVENKFRNIKKHSAISVARGLYIPKTTVLKLLRCIRRMSLIYFRESQFFNYTINSVLTVNFFLFYCDEDIKWPMRILKEKEVNISLAGNVNSKNCIHWADENVAPATLHDAVTTCAALQEYSFSVAHLWCGHILPPFWKIYWNI